MANPATFYSNVLEGEIAGLRQEEVELIQDIALALNAPDEQTRADRQRLQEIAQDLREMFFLVVVIGEFNAGKSTFINALLGYKLLDSGITPTTEFIELVRYNETPQTSPKLRDDGLREWAHPNTGAEGVAIVDTPGTGSIFMKHEKTAKNFLHRSDLVIFLFNAKQAYAESERLYLELAKNYGKKIVLVINQVDLLSPAEQEQVRSFVSSKVKELLDLEPLIFMVSAREALDSNGETGGMDALKAHLRGVYSEARPAKQKLQAELQTAERILKNYVGQAREKTTLVTLNVDKVKGIETELSSQSAGISGQHKQTNTEILRVLEGLRGRGQSFIDKNFKLTGRSPDKAELEREFHDVVIGRSMRDMNDLATTYINSVVDQSRAYWNSVIDRLNKLQNLLEQQSSSFDAGIYAEQRENLEEAIRIAEREIQANTSGKVLEDLRSQFDSSFSTFQRSSLVTLGGILTFLVAVATPGGILAFPLVLPAAVIGAGIAAIAGIPAYRSYRKATNALRDDFDKRVDGLIKSYSDALDDLTRKERNRLQGFGKQQLTPIYSQLDTLREGYTRSLNDLETMERQVTSLHKRIEDVQ